jgi:hypothetical protein
MKNKLKQLIVFVAAGLLAACTANGINGIAPGAQVFPTATNSFLFEGSVPVGAADSPASLAGVPTVAGVFRTSPSATPSPMGIPATPTLTAQTTATPTPSPLPYTVLVYGESLHANWEVQRRSGMTVNLAATGQAYRGQTAISITQRGKGEADLLFTVSDKSEEVYQRDQVTKLSFALYSPKTPLYLDQFSVSLLGSNSQLYWSAKDDSVKSSGYGSVFPEIRLDQLGFDKAIPANTWVLVEIDLSKALALEPRYQFVTGISLKSTAGATHTLLVDDLRLTMLGKPPTPSAFLFTPPANSR